VSRRVSARRDPVRKYDFAEPTAEFAHGPTAGPPPDATVGASGGGMVVAIVRRARRRGEKAAAALGR
jgi:hypothetical protein